ncbi:Methyltransferase type 11 [Oscillochloris trichoides DG-6]|uniref:Methyltransferase type 11 n=1 Tax=Oscillochloris trichoides DG-6 TaxID=765420 RepID=E1IFD3_9CHLR|nr:class I SAM-dependent methyltransferase [Oscillochloris trichoides]EFO80103.1 Methyltransferase type 11 [Oscillochloris trichoides DG-6]
MNQPHSRFWEIFFQVYEELPRQGPGSRDCASQALSLCTHLPTNPTILDLGCGVGGQTLHLAELLPTAVIGAIDSHAPSVARLQAKIEARGLSERIRATVGDMSIPDVHNASIDLVWSEGALYNIGLPNALRICHDLLRPGGYLAFTDAVWRKEGPPPEVRDSFDLDYPEMGWVTHDIAAIQAAGFDLVGHFTLPDEAWWADFYTPMMQRITELRTTYAEDGEALAILEEIATEPAMHREYAEYYAYEFFVARRPSH